MRALRILAVAALVVVLASAPAAAHAADPIPGPVDTIPELPSSAVKRAGTTSPMQTQALVDLWRIMLGKGTAAPGSVVPLTKPPVVPLTGTQLMARSGGAAGGAVTAFGVGWALGQGGLVMYAAATGQEYSSLVCTSPDWYQGANSFMMMGVVPGCKATVSVVNPDVTPGLGPLTYGGYSVAYVGSRHLTAFGGYDVTCYVVSGSVPAGYGRQMLHANGWQGASPGYLAECDSVAGANSGVTMNNGTWSTGPIAAGVRVVRQSDGVVVAQMQETSADPTRTPKCKIQWEDGTTTTGSGLQYTEGTGILLSAAGVGCEQAYVSKPGRGPDLLPRRISIGSTPDTGGSETTISDIEVPDYTAPQRTTLDPGSTQRGLVLEKVVNGTTFSCNAWATDCTGWWTATSNGTTPGQYRCTFGGTAVSLTECGPYRHTFDTRTNTPTITDPTTGAEVGWSAQPSTGNSINPGTGPGTGANPADACFDTGWAEVANPVDWVLVPVKCALVWAFVPRPAVVQAAATSAGQAWDGKPPAVIASFLGGLALAPQPEGCAVAVTLFGQTFNVIDNCPGSWMGPVTAISRVVTSIGMVILVVVVVRRQIAGMVGYDNDH